MKLAPCQVPVLSLDRQRLELWNAAMSRCGTEIELHDFRFRFGPGKMPGPKKIALAITLASGPVLFIAIDGFDFEDWTGTQLTYREVNSLPATIRKAVDRGIVDLVLGQLPAAFGNRIGHIQPVDPARLRKEAKQRPISWLEVALLAPEMAPIELTVGVRPEELADILERNELDTLVAQTRELAEIPVPLRYSLGSVELGLDEIAGLECGDLILFDAKSDKSVFYVTASHARYGFTGEKGKWTCFEIRPLARRADDPDPAGGGQEMTEDAQIAEQTANESLGAASEIPIQLDFDIGSLTVPFGELAQWQPGTIVEIVPPRIDESIEVIVRANGRRIGSGDLVRVGERLAVRLARIAGLGEAAPAGDES